YEYIYCAYEYDNLKWYQDFSIHAVRRPGQEQRTLKDELIKRFSSTLTQQRNNRRKRNAAAAAAGGDGSSRSSNKRRGKSKRLPEGDKTGTIMRRRGGAHSIRREEEEASSSRVCDVCRDADEVDDNPIIYCKIATLGVGMEVIDYVMISPMMLAAGIAIHVNISGIIILYLGVSRTSSNYVVVAVIMQQQQLVM
ncbi:hypothetical protein FOZ61_002079, partial [Perkinsus olseni]